MEGKLRSNTHIPDFHDAVCDNDLSRAIEQELYLVMYYCPTLLFWSLSRFIFLGRLIKSAPQFRSLWPTGAAIAIRFHVSISAPWAPLSIDRIKLYIRHEQCFAFETGFTYSSWNVASEWHHYPPSPPSEEWSRCKGVLTMIHSHDLLNLSRTAVYSSKGKISRRLEKPIFPWGVFHLRWLSPHFFSFFFSQQIFSPLLHQETSLNSQIYWVFEYWKEGWNPYLRELARRAIRRINETKS